VRGLTIHVRMAGRIPAISFVRRSRGRARVLAAGGGFTDSDRGQHGLRPFAESDRDVLRYACGHLGVVNTWPHSLHRTQLSASHVCRCILARGSVSGLLQWVQGGVEA
jgi:hypothetical protein